MLDFTQFFIKMKLSFDHLNITVGVIIQLTMGQSVLLKTNFPNSSIHQNFFIVSPKDILEINFRSKLKILKKKAYWK